MDGDDGALSCLWLLDVRELWPGKKINDAAPDALRMLSPDEQDKARKFYFVRDAKLSVGSSLLKRLFVSKFLDVSWSQVQFTRLGNPTHGKPCYNPNGASEPPADFNVTHQAGLVALAGSRTAGVQYGVDVVCVNERNERKHVEEEGLKSWVEIHREVFSDADMHNMIYTDISADEGAAAADQTDAKLRRFFAYWALKEAYVKLEGEALLADWLRDVEFRNVRVPSAATGAQSTRVSGIEVWLKGRRREDVTMSLESYEEKYMIATAVKRAGGSTTFPTHPVLQVLDFVRHIAPFAEKQQ